MRYVLLLLVLAAPVVAQTPSSRTFTITGEWVGPLELNQRGVGYLVVASAVTFAYKDGSLTGHFQTGGGSSGELTGTIDRAGKIRLALTIFGDGQHYDEFNQPTTSETERCHGTGTLDGLLLPSGVMRIATRVIKSSTKANEVRGKACQDITNVTWTLQREDRFH